MDQLAIAVDLIRLAVTTHAENDRGDFGAIGVRDDDGSGPRWLTITVLR